jgi:2'-5' RNA ligase
MAHSIELLFDAATEQAIVRDWSALVEAGLPSQARHSSPTNRPHVTVAVSGRIESGVDDDVRALAAALPLSCRVGAPMLFGTQRLTLVRLIVPTAELLRLHDDVDRVATPYMPLGPYPHSRPGHWTPHVTLCRRLAPADVAAALGVIDVADLEGAFGALRRWDGDAKVDTVLI